MTSERGTVYLVGAGPGDPELITVRGRRLVESCDALVYDSLVAPELVRIAPAEEKVYVGKTQGGQAMSQPGINALLVELATRAGGPRRIVRLKGGDPYLFGRGAEEVLACVEAGVPVEVVPGVTAALGATAYAGIPLTHRETSSGVHLVTGHRAEGAAPDRARWAQSVRAGETLVIYMGVGELAGIARDLLAGEVPSDTPAAVIQEGTLPGQRRVVAPLADLVRAAEAAQVRAPALIVIGRTVDFSAQIPASQPRPLAGQTVVVLRAEESAYEQLDPLRAAGARVIEVPIVRAEADPPAAALRGALSALGGDDVVLFTTASGVRFFAAAWRALESRPSPRFAARSRSVRAALHRAGLQVALSPREEGADYSAAFLAEAGVAAGETIWLPRSHGAGDAIPDALAAAGYRPRPLPVYRARPVPLPGDVRSLLAGGRADWLLFISGAAVEAAVAAVPELAGPAGESIRFAAVGRLSAERAARRGLVCEIVAPRPRVDALVEAVLGAAAPA